MTQTNLKPVPNAPKRKRSRQQVADDKLRRLARKSPPVLRSLPKVNPAKEDVEAGRVAYRAVTVHWKFTLRERIWRWLKMKIGG